MTERLSLARRKKRKKKKKTLKVDSEIIPREAEGKLESLVS